MKHSPLVLKTRPQAAIIRATPFTWSDPAGLPRRRWIYGKHYARKFFSATIATGGVGKSSNSLVEAVAMATGRPLLGEDVHERCKVWLWNGEDPQDENQRRLHAVLRRYEVPYADVAGRLFLDSGRDSPLVLVKDMGGRIVTDIDLRAALIRTIQDNAIDVLIVDPFKMTHQVSENDNGAMDHVVREWAGIADHCNIAVEIIHHARKPAMGQTSLTVDDSRGAGAVINAARNARTLNRMTRQEGAEAGVENFRYFFKIETGKANMSPPAAGATWRKMVSVPLANGDDVGVAEAWKWPDPFGELTAGDLLAVQKAIDGKGYRTSAQSANWVGKAIAEILGIDCESESGKARIKALIRTWLKSGALKEVRMTDRKGMARPILEVGQWVDA